MRLNNSIRAFIIFVSFVFVGAIHSPLFAYDLLTSGELDQLSEMLSEMDLNPEHTAFHRDWDSSTLGKTQWHMSILQDGLGSLSLLSDLRELMASEDLDAMLSHYAEIAWETHATVHGAQALDFKDHKALFRYVENSYTEIERELSLTFSDLSPAELDSLSAYLLLMMSEDQEACLDYLASASLPDVSQMKISDMIPLLMKVDFAAYATAAASMRRLHSQISEYRPQNKRIRRYKSRWGLMILGTNNDDIYSVKSIKELGDHPICLLIDPGGNDIYDFPLVTGRKHPFYIHIDHAGDDVYRSSEPSFFAFGGIGISDDRAGDDVYHLADYSFAAILGVQIHIDHAGDDIYRGGLFAQGAGICGISLLVDKSGNDSYSAHAMAQGFGSTFGAGILADYDGADTYYLGGKYFHAPLMPNDYRTMGQGMGFGIRPHLAGGLGSLYDKSGNDKYLGGVYAQGVGYWYATGLLFDEDGNDVYNAIYYPQGSGIHMASGILYDHDGDDAYYSRHGPGQGAGHDWSFGLFIDAGGNDAYSIEGGGGLGLTNSLGIFVDRAGNDRYERRHEQNYGYANFSRSTGGIGLFLDGSGEDIYATDAMADGTTWQKGSYGMGRDLTTITSENEEDQPPIEQESPPKEDAEISEIFAAAAAWEVGSAVEKVRSAREILRRRQEEASEYILANKLDTNSGLEYRALEAFTRDNPDFALLLLDYVQDPDSLKAKTAMSLLAGEKDMRLLPHLEGFLEEGKYQSACISILGNLDDPRSLEMLMQLKEQDSERLRFMVARSLSMHGSGEAKAALESFVDDESFLIQALIRNKLKE
mgnify:CR=1 FL=1